MVKRRSEIWLGIVKALPVADRLVAVLVLVVLLAIALSGCGRLAVQFDGEIPPVVIPGVVEPRPSGSSSITLPGPVVLSPEPRMSASSGPGFLVAPLSEGVTKSE